MRPHSKKDDLVQIQNRHIHTLVKNCYRLKHSEENITVDCEIKTLEVDEFTEISLADQCTLNKVVVNAAPLVEALSDLDTTSDELELTLSPEFPFFRITTSSVMVSYKLNRNASRNFVV